MARVLTRRQNWQMSFLFRLMDQFDRTNPNPEDERAKWLTKKRWNQVGFLGFWVAHHRARFRAGGPPHRESVMGWSIGYDDRLKRDIGYGVPGICDYPDCGARIWRGLDAVCGSQPYGGSRGCGLHFCDLHVGYGLIDAEDDDDVTPQMCARCLAGEAPYEPTPDLPEWMSFKLADESWGRWREENPGEVEAIEKALAA